MHKPFRIKNHYRRYKKMEEEDIYKEDEIEDIKFFLRELAQEE